MIIVDKDTNKLGLEIGIYKLTENKLKINE